MLTLRRTLCVALLALGAVAPLSAAGPAPSIKDEMRQPQRRTPEFLRTWLLCGPFANVPAAGATGPRAGLTKDYLAEHGGEAAIRPTAGMAHALPGGAAAWTSYTSPKDYVDLQAYYTGLGKAVEQTVAYAFATVTRPAEEHAALAVGSDDGVRVWLNGDLVLDHAVDRGAGPDQDIVPVTLRAGENRLLAKIDQGAGGWGFYLRVVKAGEARLLDAYRIFPSLSRETTPDQLVITTDLALAGQERPALHIDVLAAGGRQVASLRLRRGETARFDASAWLSGPYEAVVHLALPDGQEKLASVPWYKGDARAAAKHVVDAAKTVDRTQPYGATYAMLAEMLLDRLGGPVSAAKDAQLPAIYDQLMEVAELEQAHTGGPGGAHAHGMLRLAYVDDIDGSPQWCRAYLPANYDPQRKWPLIVVLHGFNPPNPTYVKWWSAADRHDWFADAYGAIVIHPLGRYNTSYNGIGDRDVLRDIELAKQRFSVDEDRVYLMGYSMGGGGTWHVGTRHPDLFAALMPIYGGFDFRFYVPEDVVPKFGPWLRLMVDRQSSFAQAEQLLNLPLWQLHGDADQTVDVGNSRYAVRMLQRWGYNVRYWEIPGLGHEAVNDLDQPLLWMLSQRRNANPKQVRVRSADLTYAAAYWVRVTQRDDPLAFITAEAQVIGPNQVRLDTEHAAELVLTPKAPLVDPAQPLHVVWNGEELTVPFDAQGRAVLRAADYRPSGLVKTAAIEGPLSDLENTPFAIVQGTTATDPMMRRLVDVQVRRAVRDWETQQHTTPRLFRDTEVSDADLARYSLILIGGPSENAVTKRLADRLPLRISAAEVTIDGRAFPAKDAWVRMIYPSPLNSDRYVLVVAATSPAGMYLAGGTPELAGMADFAIVDGRMPDAGQGRQDEQVYPALGVFDRNWRLTSQALTMGDEKVRAKSPLRRAPSRLSAETTENRLWLSEVLESTADGTFTRLMRDTSWSGARLTLDRTRYTRGLAVNTTDGPNGADFDLAGAWKRLRGVIGIEYDPTRAKQERDNTHVFFIVKGDGKELYRSPEFVYGTKPVRLDVDLTGVKTLRLELSAPLSSSDAVQSADWADLRLER